MENNQPPKTSDTILGTVFGSIFIGKAQKSILIQILTGLLILTFFYGAWQQTGRKVLAESRYQAGKQDLIVLSPPFWISPHFIDEVLENYKKNNQSSISIVNRNDIESLYHAFAGHPWVKRVESIEVQYPPRILIRLNFRVPTAVVEAAPGKYGTEFSSSVFPIDEEGVVLPNDYLIASQKADPDTVYNYIWISGIQSTPLGGIGESWKDPAVENAALLAELLRDDAKRLGIQKIAAVPEPPEIAAADPLFDLETTRKNKIRWGEFPASAVISARKIPDGGKQYETLKEQLFARQREKIEKLAELVRRYGSLDDLPKDQIPVDLSNIDRSHAGLP